MPFINYSLTPDPRLLVTQVTSTKDLDSISSTAPLVIPFSSNVAETRELTALNRALDGFYATPRTVQAAAVSAAFEQAITIVSSGSGQAVPFTQILRDMQTDFNNGNAGSRAHVRVVGIPTLNYSKTPPAVSKAEVSAALQEFNNYARSGAVIYALQHDGNLTVFPRGGIAQGRYNTPALLAYYNALQAQIHNYFNQVASVSSATAAAALTTPDLTSIHEPAAASPGPSAEPGIGVPLGSATLPKEITVTINTPDGVKTGNIKFDNARDHNGYLMPTDSDIRNALATPGLSDADVIAAKAQATAQLINQIGVANVTLTGNVDKWVATIKAWQTATPRRLSDAQIAQIIDNSPIKIELQAKLSLRAGTPAPGPAGAAHGDAPPGDPTPARAPDGAAARAPDASMDPAVTPARDGGVTGGLHGSVETVRAPAAAVDDADTSIRRTPPGGGRGRG